MEEFFDEHMPIEFEAAREWISENCDSYKKIPAVLHLHGQIDFREWLTLVGEFWSGSDGIGNHADDLLWIFREWLDHPETMIPELMDEEEREIYDALPDQVTIYRGCGAVNKAGSPGAGIGKSHRGSRSRHGLARIGPYF